MATRDKGRRFRVMYWFHSLLTSEVFHIQLHPNSWESPGRNSGTLGRSTNESRCCNQLGQCKRVLQTLLSRFPLMWASCGQLLFCWHHMSSNLNFHKQNVSTTSLFYLFWNRCHRFQRCTMCLNSSCVRTHATHTHTHTHTHTKHTYNTCKRTHTHTHTHTGWRQTKVRQVLFKLMPDCSTRWKTRSATLA